MNQSAPNRIYAVSYCIIPSHADCELGAFTIVVFHSLSGKSLDGLDYPFTDGIMSDCSVTDWIISDAFLAKFMEKTFWATFGLQFFV